MKMLNTTQMNLTELKQQWMRPMGALAVAFLVAGCSAQAEPEATFSLDQDPVQGTENGLVRSYAEVLEPARMAVVSVTTASIVEIMQNRGRSPIEDLLRRYYGIPEQGPNRQDEPQERRIPNGLGSGVIISPDGYILTNNHVISDERGDPADEITVQLNDGTEVEAALVGRDERTDVALLKIEADDLAFIPMADSQNLRVGDIVFAIGNPLGVGLTSTMGIVSATGRTNLGLLGREGYENFIQTDAAINRGNSGGALVDARGRLVGINTAIYSRTGGNIGIGFAIPSRLARNVVLELIENGQVRRGYLGVSISDLNPELAEAFGLESTEGALISGVQPGTPADQAGMVRGDVIVSVAGEPVSDVSDLRLTVAGLRPGTETAVKLIRDGNDLELMVTLGSLDDPTAIVSTSDSPLEGIGLEPVSDSNREQWSLELESGVLVTEVNPRSPYADSLTPGMVILEVNDSEVSTVGQIADAIRVGRVNKLWISFRGNRGFLALRVD
jgi:Do/DeqQ family serine protease